MEYVAHYGWQPQIALKLKRSEHAQSQITDRAKPITISGVKC